MWLETGPASGSGLSIKMSISAKVSTIVYVVISFEIGILLMILPWYAQFWESNLFLFLMTEKFRAGWLPGVVNSGWVRGAVTGLGVVNLLFGLREISSFRRRAEDAVTNGSDEEQNAGGESAEAPAAGISDQRPSGHE
jgi:hypothetical protein